MDGAACGSLESGLAASSPALHAHGTQGQGGAGARPGQARGTKQPAYCMPLGLCEMGSPHGPAPGVLPVGASLRLLGRQFPVCFLTRRHPLKLGAGTPRRRGQGPR